jgi:subtilisin family serine protease
MAWTHNRNRSRAPERRHVPGMDSLDERCLLSTGAGTALAHHAVPQHRVAASNARAATPRLKIHHPVRHQASRSTPGPQALSVTTSTQAAPTQPRILEKPVGTIVTGTPTAFDPIVGAAQTRAAFNVDGTGMTVAVIDTGVDYKNPALGGGFGPGTKVIAGYNFATNTPDPLATTSQHGTAVAGLIGSSDPNHLGVAPGVNIVALKVVGDNNSADLNSIARALQWVVDNHAKYNVTVVNMSLSDGGNYAQNWFAHDGGPGQQITELVGELKNLNIPVVSATGNSFTGNQGEGFTSIVGGVISVTATDTTDQLLPDAQRLGAATGMGTATELAAPGKGFVAPSGDNGVSAVDGTSFATPLVTGSVVLLQQIYQSHFGTLPTVDQVTKWLEQGADPIHDAVTGITIGRLDIPKAASLIAPATPVSTPPPVSTPTPTPTPAPTKAPTPATVPVTQTSGSSTSTGSIPVSYVPATPTPAPTPTTAQEQLATNVQVFVNGQPVRSLGASSSGSLASLSQTGLDSLLKAMSAWASNGGNDGGKPGTSQVRIWGATTQPAGASLTGPAYPAGTLATLARHARRLLHR